MGEVLTINNIKSKKIERGWIIEKINEKTGETTKNPHLPRLAKAVSESCNYKQYQKMDYIYNGKCYEIVRDEEHMQNKVTAFLNEEEMNYKFNTVTDVVKMMKAENTISTSNKEKWISLNNGIMNLETFEIIQHTPEKFTTLHIDANYELISEEEYMKSDFRKYLVGTFGGDEELISQAIEILAMCLSPNPKKFQKAVVLEGEGSNGKSVFIDICQALASNSYSTVAFKDIDGHKYANANMLGCTVNIDADASGDRLEDTSNFKKITAGDPITVEPKGKGLLTINLDILLILAVNKMPTSKDKSNGFIRRFNIIPFESTFVDDISEVDESKRKFLKDKELTYKIINNELNIVLYKAVQALAKLKRTNYSMTSSVSVKKATERYSLVNDNVKAFYLDNATGKDYFSSIKSSNLYTIYERWCKENEERPVLAKTFGSLMSKYYKKKRTSNGMVYLDVTLHHQSEYLGSIEK